MGQVIFNSTNLIMSHQFVQNKFVQEFVVVSLLYLKATSSFQIKSFFIYGFDLLFITSQNVL